jgi:hypothetical protein
VLSGGRVGLPVGVGLFCWSVDPGTVGQVEDFRCCRGAETVRMTSASRIEHTLTAGGFRRGKTVMHISRSVQSDPGVPMLMVVPGRETIHEMPYITE